MPVATAKGIVTNLVALRACPLLKPCLTMVTTHGLDFVIAVGVYCRVAKCDGEESGLQGCASSGCGGGRVMLIVIKEYLFFVNIGMK